VRAPEVGFGRVLGKKAAVSDRFNGRPPEPGTGLVNIVGAFRNSCQNAALHLAVKWNVVGRPTTSWQNGAGDVFSGLDYTNLL